jgi:hypothetical protein
MQARLSESPLFDNLLEFYQRKGVAAFDVVPNYITSNCFLAQSFVDVILAFVRDHNNVDCNASLQSKAVYIVELGSGSGKLSFLLLKKLAELRTDYAVPECIRFCLVMTDVEQRFVESWRQSGYFRDAELRGDVDYALFNAECDRRIDLQLRGHSISSGQAPGAVVVLANYVLDSLRQDCFVYWQRALCESLPLLQCRVPPSHARYLSELDIGWRHRELTDAQVAGYYGRDSVASAILIEYSRCFADLDRGGGASFSMPVGAFRAFDSLRAIVGDRCPMLWLVGDKGCTAPAHMCDTLGSRAEPASPDIQFHGNNECLSFTANLHAFGRYVELGGGDGGGDSDHCAFALHMNKATCERAIDVSAFVWRGRGRCVQTRAAYAQSIDSFGPDMYFSIYRGLRTHRSDNDSDVAATASSSSAQMYADASTEVPRLLALLNMSKFDADLAFKCAPALVDTLASLPSSLADKCTQALLVAYSYWYMTSASVDNDLPFALGTLFLTLDDKERVALPLFKASRKHFGAAAATEFNIAACHRGMHQYVRAVRHLERCLSLDPQFPRARRERDDLKPLADAQAKREQVELERREQAEKQLKYAKAMEKSTSQQSAPVRRGGGGVRPRLSMKK